MTNNQHNTKYQPAAMLLLLLLPGVVHSTSSTDPAFIKECLDMHNKIRAAHSAPPLTWDARLADVAQRYSATCPTGHSMTPGLGENLAGGYATATEALQAMWDERQLYNWNDPKFSKEAGHFTAIVWRDTTHVGCGMTDCSHIGDGNGNHFGNSFVCEYTLHGNVEGLFPQNVIPEGGKPPPKSDQGPPGSPPDNNNLNSGEVSGAPAAATARPWGVVAVTVMLLVWGFAGVLRR